MRVIQVTVGPLVAASANNICQSQTPGAAGNLTLNGSLVSGGVAILDTPRRVLVTTVGNESAKTITFYGTGWNGEAIAETMTGPNATTAYTIQDFKTVTQIAVSAAFAGAVTVGTNTIASSRPIAIDNYGLAPAALQVDVSGTVNATVQQTLDEVSPIPTLAQTLQTVNTAYTGATWVNHPDANLVGLTGPVQGNYGYMPRYVRLLLNSGNGSATLYVAQSGGNRS